MLRRRKNARLEPPLSPIGGKLEITHACNLRCGFCYTDSPRRTLQRAVELDDEQWLAVVDQLIAAGAIEAVITGGEPLLRRDLTVEVCQRLAGAGLAVSLNSNGWFIDDEVAAALAAARGLETHISVDGPSPAVHDASRGVPGSWRRAIAGIDALIRHGVVVHVVHVITADNVEHVGRTLELLETLGVSSIRATRVIEIGAAARQGSWRVASRRLEREVADYASRSDSVPILLRSGEGGADAQQSQRPPAALLVQPNGMVRTDSLTPFTFGHALDDGLEVCWRRIRERWQDPAISSWRSTVSSPRDWTSAPIVPYLDDEVDVTTATAAIATAGGGREEDVPRPVPARSSAAAGIVDPAAHVLELARLRLYRRGDVRVGGDPGGRVVRRIDDGGLWRLNRSASIVFDAVSGARPVEAESALAAAHPSEASERLRDDVLAVVRSLCEGGLIVPVAAAAAPSRAASSPPPDLPGIELG